MDPTAFSHHHHVLTASVSHTIFGTNPSYQENQRLWLLHLCKWCLPLSSIIRYRNYWTPTSKITVLRGIMPYPLREKEQSLACSLYCASQFPKLEEKKEAKVGTWSYSRSQSLRPQSAMINYWHVLEFSYWLGVCRTTRESYP